MSETSQIVAQISEQLEPDSIRDQDQDDDHWTWLSWQVILLIANAVLGLVIFEWSWCKVYRFRHSVS